MISFNRKAHLPRVVGATICLSFLVIIISSVASAAPSIEQKKQEAAQVQAEINQIDTQLDQAVEEYNLARIELEKVEKEVEKNRQDLAQTTQELKEHQELLNRRVSSIYKENMPSLIPVILNANSFDNFLLKIEWLIEIANQDVRLVKKIVGIKKKIEMTRTELDKQKQEKLAVKNQLEKQKQNIEGKIAYKTHLLTNIQGEISSLIKQQQEAERRQQSQIAQQVRTSIQNRSSGGGSRSGSGRGSSSPPPRKEGGSVVSIALSYLGVPYSYGGSSPSTGFDCSGFTMYVYRQAGKSLPHSSRMQYNCGARVSKENLQAGDLVFFGLDGIHHVGIYIGGGRYVHAPRTGDVVKISSLSARRDYAGACRP